jgi:hypothetical protein
MMISGQRPGIATAQGIALGKMRTYIAACKAAIFLIDPATTG